MVDDGYQMGSLISTDLLEIKPDTPASSITRASAHNISENALDLFVSLEAYSCRPRVCVFISSSTVSLAVGSSSSLARRSIPIVSRYRLGGR